MTDKTRSGSEIMDGGRRGAPRGHHRISQVPPLPATEWPDWAVLQDHLGALGLVLWRGGSDALLWGRAETSERAALFNLDGDTEMENDVIASAIREAPEISEAISTLWAIHKIPELLQPHEVADACTSVALWAEVSGMKGTAVQFSELAARLEPNRSPRSFTAGRLCRRKGEHQRAAIWYRRAARLARLDKNKIDLANAHLGLGNLETELGNKRGAEEHFLKAARSALRNGRRSLAAAAYHNLVGVAYDLGNKEVALKHLKTAAEFYRVDHPRFPALAYDAGFFLMREGYFSSALLLFEQVLPWVEGQRVSILVRSALARSAAAVRDNIRYQRQCTAVLGMVAVDDEDSANALYQLAEGARSFMDWARAEAFAVRALALAEKRDDRTIAAYASALLAAITLHQQGDIDRVPPEGDPVDAVTLEVLRKLNKRTMATPIAEAVPPERFPIE